VLDVVSGVGLGQRMAPGSDVVPGGHDERAEPYLPFRCAHLSRLPKVSPLDTLTIYTYSTDLVD
jgi:hypothetical protein